MGFLILILVGLLITIAILVFYSKDRDTEVANLYLHQKRALYWVLGLIYLGFLALQLSRVPIISDSYSLHSMMFAIVNLVLFVIPFALFIYLYLLMKYLRNGVRRKITPGRMKKSFLIVASIVAVFAVVTVQVQEISIYGVYEVEQKGVEDGKYYVVFDHLKIKVTRNEYHLIEENQKYGVSFVLNKLSSNKRKLKTIEPLE